MVFFTTHKCRRILRSGYRALKKKGHLLTEKERHTFEADLRSLDQALLTKRKDDAVVLAKRIDAFMKSHFKKGPFELGQEIVYALLFAILVAFIIRQFWFELYEVPTGSMRPTVEELDRMVVSKTTFGINLPFRMKPVFFSEDYIKRAGIIVFTVQNMDVADGDMRYFYLFPGKKRYIKRCCAKPGDTIYFYGGRIYGIDQNGNPFNELSDEAFLKEYGIGKIDHIPYISFEGKALAGNPLAQNLYGSVLMKQMNIPVAKIEMKRSGGLDASFYNGKNWVADKPYALKAPHDQPMSYSELWGMGNYAMARLLTKEEVELFYESAPESNEALLYLEMRHTPNLTYPRPEIRKDEHGRYLPMLTPMVALIPLKRSHLDAIHNTLITARFFVKKGKAYRYVEGRNRPQHPELDPPFPQVPDGCYEFYYGKGYKILFGGIRTELAPNHPLYDSSPENIRTLFNMGINFNIVFEPVSANQPYIPQRFAYFREGDLYLMGAPVIKKNDPTLVRFLQKEMEKQNASSREKPYIAFVDHGPPVKEGKLDVEFIRNFGLRVPDASVVALGDNYAMSADSRDFGFVPNENLRGSPSFTFWPPSSRFGRLAQPPYPWLTLPNILVWIAVILVFLIWWLVRQSQNRRSIFKDGES